MLLKNLLHHRRLGRRLVGVPLLVLRLLVVVHVELQDVPVFDGVIDGVGVQLTLEDVFRGLVAGFLAFDLNVAGVLVEDRCSGKPEQLRVGEVAFDGFVVLAKLRAVALVEDEDDAPVLEGFQLALVLLFPAAAEGQAQLLDGCHNDFIGLIGGEKPLHQFSGVGILLDAARLETVELLTGLTVEVFAIHHEDALVDLVVVLQQGRRLEGS